MTQEELGERSGINQSKISLYAAGKQRPNLINAIALEDASDGEIDVHDWAKIETVPKSSKKVIKKKWMSKTIRK